MFNFFLNSPTKPYANEEESMALKFLRKNALKTGVLVLMVSNPTRLIGYFYDSHHSDQRIWQRFTFDSEESPIVDWEYVERIEMISKRKLIPL